MVIKLPDSFEKTYHDYHDRECYAVVRHGFLEIYGDFELIFEKLMKDLAFELKGRNKCYYCQKEVNENEITIDHLYPRHFGGITIPNNLEPSCPICNVNKSDMNEKEFIQWKKLDDKQKQKRFYREKINLKKASNGIDLPEKWLTQLQISHIKVKTQDHKGKRKNSHEKCITVVVSANDVLLAGIKTIEEAKKIGAKMITAVVLENVIWLEN